MYKEFPALSNNNNKVINNSNGETLKGQRNELHLSFVDYCKLHNKGRVSVCTREGWCVCVCVREREREGVCLYNFKSSGNREGTITTIRQVNIQKL